MKAFTVLCVLALCFLLLSSVYADSESEKGVEVFGGYTRVKSDDFCCAGQGSGYHLGGGYAPIRFLLLNAEYSYADAPDPGYMRHLHAGPQVRVPLGIFWPFGRVMAGFTEHRLSCANLPPDFPALDRKFSVAFGGGVDLQVHRRVGLRLFVLDRIRAQDQWDLRASFGVVFRLF
ncbi:MAG: hypothetical protein EHM61_10570 [Acidobacteria bacterium]|nr:MAG: hypothetical protein EHM61_10570 [Acidobacteriota bacterium]